MSPDSPYHRILAEFPGLTRFAPLSSVKSYGIEHRIITEGSPKFSVPRRLSPEKLKFAKEEFKFMMEQGICRPSSSTWAAPLHMVPKSENVWRLCGDYRALNSATIPDRYPLPHIQDFTSGLYGKNIFSKIDLVKAYYQVPVAKEDIHKIAVTTPFGLFEFLVMPFGLRNAAQTFQRLMNSLLSDLDFVFCYLDDILIASKNEQEHIAHLRIIFDRLLQAGMSINVSKCLFGQKELSFLGYLVSDQAIKPTTEKVKSIIDFPKPKTIHDMRRFIGIINYYRRCLKNAAEHQALLTEFLKDSRKRDRRVIPWNNETETAFQNCKEELLRVTTLSHPAPHVPLILTCDASNFAVGASLEQTIAISLDELADYQKEDEELQDLLSSNSSLQLRKLILSGSTSPIYCDCSSELIRPYVPKSLRKRIFDVVHGLAHPSGRSTAKQLLHKFIWPSLKKDVKEWTRTCLPCQRSKISRHTKNVPVRIEIPDQRFQHVHLDLIGPLPSCQDFRYCLTIIDRFSRWPEAIPLKEISADTVSTAFYTHWVARYGSPLTITTDQGSQFEASLFKALTNLIGCDRKRTSAYHPASNGILERWHRTVKTAIMCHQTKNWLESLPSVLLGLRSCFKEDLKASPAELLYGTTLRIPGGFFIEEDFPADPEIFLEKHRIHMRNVRSSPTSHHIKKSPFGTNRAGLSRSKYARSSPNANWSATARITRAITQAVDRAHRFAPIGKQ
ncbi:uncharacterized protein K02A2.6-like [Solenopsis invicta]|uniref:uncharacterized protein K02A2.6-like n=1 Tax=Solenopsis invicta TaxID=13686 RepID=UPI00193EBD69|nr:uncharacterized protein K02A2.6-like [Solenopsis invicta]